MPATPNQRRSAFLRSSVAFAAATVTASSARRAEAAGLLTPLKVAASPIDPMALVYYAKDQGYFERAGLDVTIIPLQGGGAGPTAAILGGALDLAIVDATVLAGAHLHGVNFKLIAPGAIATPETRTDQLAVANESPITKGSDLNGKTIGVVELKSLQQTAVMAWVEKYGGDPKSLKFIEVPFPVMATAVEQGRVDAVALTEPFLTFARGKVRGLGNVMEGIAPRFIILEFFSSDSWLQAHSAVAATFASVIRQTAIWANAHHAESGQILVRNSKLPPEVANAMARSIYGTAVEPSLVQPTIDAAARYGIIERGFPASEIIWSGH
jgi:NitT/TauT family transport system substrate-binding protein